ncbi:MAG: CopD family protein [Rhodospirillales bacterium]
MPASPWDIASIGLAAAGCASVCQAAGASLFVALYGGQMAVSDRCIRRLGAAVAVVGIAMVLTRTLLEPAHLAGSAAGIADGSLHFLVMTSDVGTAAALRIAGLALIATMLCRRQRAADVAAVVGAVVACASFALTGHTVASPARPLLLPLLTAHLLLAAFWFGALWPLRMLAGRESATAASAVLADYSRHATALVPALALAGMAIAAGLAEPLVAIPASPWGRLLLLKLALFALLMGLAAVNKLRLVPRLSAGDPRAATALRFSIICEIALILVIFATTAVLTGLFSPARRGRGDR